MRELIEIESEWLLEISPNYYKQSDFMDVKDRQREKKKLSFEWHPSVSDPSAIYRKSAR